jgi:hypothetical protein
MGLQSSIRNTMAANETQRQDRYMAQQDRRDWWFQVQQQQNAQQQTRRYAMPAMPSMPAAPSGGGFESVGVETGAPEVATDVIKWLPVLCDPQFAADRAKIEAPYRRSSQGLSRPNADDYRGMIVTTEQMKATLKTMAAEISAQDYLSAEAFLDQLASEARGRIQGAAPTK